MADDPRKALEDNIKQTKELTEQQERSVAAGKQEAEGYKINASELRKLKEAREDIIKQHPGLMSALYDEKLKEIPGVWNGIKESVGGLGGVFDGVAKTFQNFGSQVSKNKDLIAMLNPQFREMIDVSKEFKPFSSSMLSPINDSIKSLLPSQTLARETFTSFGDSIKEANEKASKYPQTLISMSSAFGVTTEELNKFNDSIKTVPGALDNVKGSILGITSLNGTFVQTGAALLTTLKGIGLSSTESAQFVKNAFENFGRSAGQITKIIGDMSEASKGSGLSSKFVSDSILAASTGLGIFGEKAGLATNVWKTFSDELRGSGVAVSSINSIVNDFVSNISKMPTENKAFIGMMSGMMRGSSAMGGALRMEMSMRSEGGLEQTMQMLTSTLSSFAGGKIINLEQAATNPQLENLFVLQRQTLGKLTGISDTEKQNRILEVLQNVQQGGVSQVQGSKALQEVFDKGQNIQERQVTSIERIEQILRSTLVGGAIEKITNFDQVLRGQGSKDLSRTAIVDGAEQQNLFKSGTRGLINQLGDFINQNQNENENENFEHLPQFSKQNTNFNARMNLSDHTRKSNLLAILTANREPSPLTEEIPTESAKTPSYMMGGANLLTSASAQSKIVNWPRPQQDTGAIQESLPQAKRGISISSSEHTITVKIQNDDDALNRLSQKITVLLGGEIPNMLRGENKI